MEQAFLIPKNEQGLKKKKKLIHCVETILISFKLVGMKSGIISYKRGIFSVSIVCS